LDDICVDKIGHELGFTDEIFDELLLVGVGLSNNLNGHTFHEAPRTVLLGLVNDAHSTFKDLANDLVSEIALNREERHKRMLVEAFAKSSPAAPGVTRPL
jgi:hypothetical protein